MAGAVQLPGVAPKTSEDDLVRRVVAVVAVVAEHRKPMREVLAIEDGRKDLSVEERTGMKKPEAVGLLKGEMRALM
jgi:hypothetical protein